MKRILSTAALGSLALMMAACQPDGGTSTQARMEATPAENPADPWATYANPGWDHERAEVQKTDTGLEYIVLAAGPECAEGPTGSDRAFVHYEGRLDDGTVFDSSFSRGSATDFPADAVISGWTEALGMMCPGDDWMLYLPSELAYGDRAVGGKIKPGDSLIFRVVLLADIGEDEWTGEAFQ